MVTGSHLSNHMPGFESDQGLIQRIVLIWILAQLPTMCSQVCDYLRGVCAVHPKPLGMLWSLAYGILLYLSVDFTTEYTFELRKIDFFFFFYENLFVFNSLVSNPTFKPNEAVFVASKRAFKSLQLKEFHIWPSSSWLSFDFTGASGSSRKRRPEGKLFSCPVLRVIKK